MTTKVLACALLLRSKSPVEHFTALLPEGRRMEVEQMLEQVKHLNPVELQRELTALRSAREEERWKDRAEAREIRGAHVSPPLRAWLTRPF